MTAAIVNPRAGAGKAASRWQAPEGVEVRYTDHPGHATEIASGLLQRGCERILVVGGDGTINEVVNGWFHDGRAISPYTILEVVPASAGSDLARVLGPSPIDVACAGFGSGTQRLFVNMASFGLGGETTRRLGARGGRTRYLTSMLRVFARLEPSRVRFVLDGRAEEVSAIHVSIGNGRYQGAGMHVCPRAELDDGLLDITVIDDLSIWELLANIHTVYNGRIYDHPKVRHFRAARIEADAGAPLALELDGEPVGALPLSVEVLPRVLRVARWRPSR